MGSMAGLDRAWSLCSFPLLLASPALAQDAGPQPLPVTIEAGVPLHVMLENRVPIKKVGTPVRGHLTEPIYVFDRVAVPAGSEVAGRVVHIDPVTKKQRTMAVMQGNFTPLRKAQIEFDALTLQNGKRLPLRTVVLEGPLNLVHLEAAEAQSSQKESAVGRAASQAGERVKVQKQEVLEQIKAPEKMQRVKAAVAAELPYHRQALPKCANFVAELQAPVELGTQAYPREELKTMESAIPPGSCVHARLESGLSSATDHVGAPVKAVVTQPLFSADQHLILPQGTRIEGFVTQVQAARRFGQNGELRFTFHQIELPSQVKQAVEASLEGAEVDSATHMKLDTEGGAHATTSKTHYIAPAIDVVLATSSLDGLDHHRRAIETGGVRGPDVGGGIVRGGAGFGFVGSLIGFAARSRPVSAGFAFHGAAWSVYSHVVERGTEVVFPKDTPIEIRFGTHGHPAQPGQRFHASETPSVSSKPRTPS